MKPAVFLMMLVALGNCSSGKAQDVAACQAEADRFFQAYRDDDVANPRGRYIIECMASKGYEFDISPADCDSRRALHTQQACFVSASWIGRLIHLFRTE
jgi:hypothetical protein